MTVLNKSRSVCTGHHPRKEQRLPQTNLRNKIKFSPFMEMQSLAEIKAL